MVTFSVRGSMLHNKQTWRSYFTFCLLSMLSFPFHHILTASDLFSHSLLFFSLIVPPTLILCMRIDYFLSVDLRFSCDDWHEPYFRNLFLCTDLDLPRKRQLLQEFLFFTKKKQQSKTNINWITEIHLSATGPVFLCLFFSRKNK